ncbi:6335_t:CDS:1 [Ambispora gerdemannii]|uniref:6335_t:CDS:1 n=1 Tax=Ambispora gerdemannii TaxID=144530 RepID=A0A9N9CK68_9GLOM|nr:6335_t:CDS:1 [Ambispora gerdemannii]
MFIKKTTLFAFFVSFSFVALLATLPATSSNLQLRQNEIFVAEFTKNEESIVTGRVTFVAENPCKVTIKFYEGFTEPEPNNYQFFLNNQDISTQAIQNLIINPPETYTTEFEIDKTLCEKLDGKPFVIKHKNDQIGKATIVSVE